MLAILQVVYIERQCVFSSNCVSLRLFSKHALWRPRNLGHLWVEAIVAAFLAEFQSIECRQSSKDIEISNNECRSNGL